MSVSKELNTRIILRNDESANWLDQELLKGEVGIEFDSSGKAKMKIGTGKSWDQTNYFGEAEAVEALEGRVEAAEEILENVYVKNDIDGKIDELNTAIANEKTRAETAESGLSDEIDNIVLAMAGKANTDDVYSKTETYTKTEVQTYVLGQIGSAGHLERKIVTELPTEDIDVDTIYMVARESITGNDAYVEYMYINGSWEVIGDTVVDLSDYAKSEDVNNSIDEINEALALKANATEVEESLATVNEAIELKANKTDVETAIGEVNAAIALKADASRVEELEGKVSAINDAESGILAQSKAYTDEEIALIAESLKSKVDTTVYESKIEEINTSITNINNIIGSGDSSDSLIARISAVETSVANKADKATTLTGYGITDAYTKGETYTRNEIAELIADITGGESAADVLAALNTYKGTNDERVGNAENRIAALENVGAQANVLEAINFNGKDIEIVDKKATFSFELPVAMADALGGVKSSDAENKISVAEDGTMEVNKVNVNKLVQTEGETLILNGGSANL